MELENHRPAIARMSFATISPLTAPAAPPEPAGNLPALAQELERWFGQEFSLWNGETGDLLRAPPGQPPGDELLRAELCRAVANSPRPRIVEDEDVVCLLALPLGSHEGPALVALAPFATRDLLPGESLSGPARLLGLGEAETQTWISRNDKWPAVALLRTAQAYSQKAVAERRVERLEREIDEVSANLATTYEEISLLHGLAQNLRISSTDEELGRQALDWLVECLPVQGVAVLFSPIEDASQSTYKARTKSTLLTAGECPLAQADLERLIVSRHVRCFRGPYVANRNVTGQPDWEFPTVRQMIVAPLCEGQNLFGWLAAFNHERDLEFGTVEASLLGSVGALLGIHSGNHEHYRQQAEFLANVVRALTSAIDAKDPYTCGHSDRVARISVRLAQHLRCEGKTLTNIYMAGLLHDIGKIGIDDNVLRKPGRLTEIEFEHIKMHPLLGYKILAELRPLADALPVVLHHHEQWNGEGYPHKLAGEQIPLSARIVAVADAYDAMSSDRPYRKGLPEEQVNETFRRGSGVYWDPQVVEAFFAVREDIRAICGRERANLTLDVQQWA